MSGQASSGEKPKVRKHLTQTEAQRLIAACGRRGRHGFRDRVLVRLIYRHGLRVAEAVGTQWAQSDLDAGTYLIKRLKGGRNSTHVLDRDELRDLRRLRKQTSGTHVFETELGGPMSVDAVQRIVKLAGQDAGLEAELGFAVHPHALRHAAGHVLTSTGHDTRSIQDFLGHADIRHTAQLHRAGAEPPGRAAGAIARSPR